MKSIIQEASSVIKAIEKAWLTAGQPREFSIKVYEEPQKNFIGMTVKSAKIGIFFQEDLIPSKREERKEIPKRKIKETAAIEEKPKVTKFERKFQEPTQEKYAGKRVIWTDEMIDAAKNWLTNALQAMEKQDVRYTTDVNNYYLRFAFDNSLAPTPEQERELFRSFSFLILQTLKRKFKRPLRGFKIVLTR